MSKRPKIGKPQNKKTDQLKQRVKGRVSPAKHKIKDQDSIEQWSLSEEKSTPQNHSRNYSQTSKFSALRTTLSLSPVSRKEGSRVGILSN